MQKLIFDKEFSSNEEIYRTFLNEGLLNNSEIEALRKLFIDNIINKNQSKLNINLKLDVPDDIRNKIIRNSAGYFVEGYIANILRRCSNIGDCSIDCDYKSNNSTYDITIDIKDNNGNERNFSVEIKAYKRLSNITLTKKQYRVLHSKDSNVYYLLIKYDIDESSPT